MRSAGKSRLTFSYSLPSGSMTGTGIASTVQEPGYLVLDDVRLDDGKELARVWVPLPLEGLLYARELDDGDDVVDAEIYLDVGSPQPDPGAWVRDRFGRTWELDDSGSWQVVAGSVSRRLPALEWAELLAYHGPVTELEPKG
ncbi:hypothetical protein ACH47B_06730 [Rhodococcus sp. NPDC019627]|uniref:hypothetical protein n=1 Tax=unclassified Rhodococcus (in: high G+C Gram-positive bacteria) TaxID=192944 RepID=UPI0037BAACFF